MASRKGERRAENEVYYYYKINALSFSPHRRCRSKHGPTHRNDVRPFPCPVVITFCNCEKRVLFYRTLTASG